MATEKTAKPGKKTAKKNEAKVEKELKEVKKISEAEKKAKPKKISQKDYEAKVIELAGKGLTSEKIGEELRNQNIHPKEFEKKISKILGSKYINPDLKNVEAKLAGIKAHYEKNKQDKRAMREKDRIFSQVRKLKKYFKIPIEKKKKK